MEVIRFICQKNLSFSNSGVKMQILHKNLRNKEIKIIIDNLDDLWHLYNIIEEDDLVSALSLRKVESKEEKLRPEKLEKKKVFLILKVEKVEFHEFSDRLRILGTINEGEEKGKYHTFNLTIGDDLKIKKEWKDWHLERINSAVKSAKVPIVIFVAIDYDECTIAILRTYGIQEVARIHGVSYGKQYSTKESKKDFYNEIFIKLKQIRSNEKLIILGPGFAKEEFFSFVKEKDNEFAKNFIIESSGQSGMVGIQELLRRGVVSKVLKESRVAEETELVEKLLEEIAKDGLAVYGKEEVKFALNLGAVEILLISDEILRRKKEEEILEIAKNLNVKIFVISSVNECGKKLNGLGGIACLTRYKIQNK